MYARVRPVASVSCNRLFNANADQVARFEGHSGDYLSVGGDLNASRDDGSQGITRSVTSTNSASTHPAATNSSTMATA